MYYAKQWICVTILVLVAMKPANSALSKEQMEKAANTMRSNCVQKVGADMSLVEGIRRGEFADDPNVKCYIHCVMKLIRTLKNGVIDVDMVVKQVDMMMPAEIQDRVKAAARKCGAEPPQADICETAYAYAKCNYEADPEVFFFP